MVFKVTFSALFSATLSSCAGVLTPSRSKVASRKALMPLASNVEMPPPALSCSSYKNYTPPLPSYPKPISLFTWLQRFSTSFNYINTADFGVENQHPRNHMAQSRSPVSRFRPVGGLSAHADSMPNHYMGALVHGMLASVHPCYW